MNGEQRRQTILALLQNEKTPIPGNQLAKELQVSRQIIVQDIALLRAANYNIFSTNKGYLHNETSGITKIFKVSHTDEQIEEELNTIVDLGGEVIDVFVYHKVYGKIQGILSIQSRRNIKEFMEGIHSGKSSPLKNITSNYHYHTVQADSKETLQLIENGLNEKGFLLPMDDWETERSITSS